MSSTPEYVGGDLLATVQRYAVEHHLLNNRRWGLLRAVRTVMGRVHGEQWLTVPLSDMSILDVAEQFKNSVTENGLSPGGTARCVTDFKTAARWFDEAHPGVLAWTPGFRPPPAPVVRTGDDLARALDSEAIAAGLLPVVRARMQLALDTVFTKVMGAQWRARPIEGMSTAFVLDAYQQISGAVPTSAPKAPRGTIDSFKQAMRLIDRHVRDVFSDAEPDRHCSFGPYPLTLGGLHDFVVAQRDRGEITRAKAGTMTSGLAAVGETMFGPDWRNAGSDYRSVERLVGEYMMRFGDLSGVSSGRASIYGQSVIRAARAFGEYYDTVPSATARPVAEVAL